jgi:hypothetical protein
MRIFSVEFASGFRFSIVDRPVPRIAEGVTDRKR